MIFDRPDHAIAPHGKAILRRTLTLVAAVVLSGLWLVALPASASTSSARVAGAQRPECGALSFGAALPAPPAGRAVRQVVTVDEACDLHTGPVEFIAAEPPTARLSDTASRQVRAYSEMYDCCRILMSALYSDTTWSTAGGMVNAVESRPSTDMNTTHLGGGWSLEAVSSSGGCANTCVSAEYKQYAEFSYQGVFDPTGRWYYNRHESAVVVHGDGTATCEQRVTLRHTFVGWNWIHGCG
jgi:hypothetical protein